MIASHVILQKKWLNFNKKNPSLNGDTCNYYIFQLIWGHWILNLLGCSGSASFLFETVGFLLPLIITPPTPPKKKQTFNSGHRFFTPKLNSLFFVASFFWGGWQDKKNASIYDAKTYPCSMARCSDVSSRKRTAGVQMSAPKMLDGLLKESRDQRDPLNMGQLVGYLYVWFLGSEKDVASYLWRLLLFSSIIQQRSWDMFFHDFVLGKVVAR